MLAKFIIQVWKEIEIVEHWYENKSNKTKKYIQEKNISNDYDPFLDYL